MSREMSCQEAAGYVYGYLDGEIEPETEEEFRRHLEMCRRCMGVVEFERRMLEFVRDRAGTERAPADLAARVREALRSPGPREV